MRLRKPLVFLILPFLCSIGFAQAPDSVMDTLKQELQRSYSALKKQPIPPYCISYQLTDNRAVSVSSSFGALVHSSDSRTRYLDLDLRVGDYNVDNTHPLTDSDFVPPSFGQFSGVIPIEDDPKALAAGLWLETDRAFKQAAQRMEAVKANGKVQTEVKKDQAADFSAAPALQYKENIAGLVFDRAQWEEKVRKYGKPFRGNTNITQASIDATGEIETRRYVNTDGSEIRMSSPLYRLNISATIRTDDGEVLPLHRMFMSYTPEGLPKDEEVQAAVSEMIKTLNLLRAAPVGDAFTGPAILSGRASAVFFHEIFGHRIEGDRLKDDDDAQTFKKKINQQILPQFLSVYSDPTLQKYGATELVGFYAFDDEGVKARRVPVVEKGIFRNFLMSRSPMDNFKESNGHGRRQQGHDVEARQANLVIEASKTMSREALKKQLIERIKKAKKPYGLFIDDIEGGFTFTQRFLPNSFKVMPTVVYRVYPDGREELVRGLDFIGTPLIAFSKISAADDQIGVFNGVCGATSGWVPVSAVSPGLLVDQIEVQRKEKSEARKPILPEPTEETPAPAAGKEAQ